jgi:hypothetical protein
VKDGEDDNSLLPHDEENVIRKAPGENAADFGLFTQAKVDARILNRALDCGTNFRGEFKTQPGFACLIVGRRNEHKRLFGCSLEALQMQSKVGD